MVFVPSSQAAAAVEITVATSTIAANRVINVLRFISAKNLYRSAVSLPKVRGSCMDYWMAAV